MKRKPSSSPILIERQSKKATRTGSDEEGGQVRAKTLAKVKNVIDATSRFLARHSRKLNSLFSGKW